VSNNANSLELLSVVATIHHERASQTLNDWALSKQFSQILFHRKSTQKPRQPYLCLSESLDCISACGMRNIDGASDVDVIGKGDVADFYIVVGPAKFKSIQLI